MEAPDFVEGLPGAAVGHRSIIDLGINEITFRRVRVGGRQGIANRIRRHGWPPLGVSENDFRGTGIAGGEGGIQHHPGDGEVHRAGGGAIGGADAHMAGLLDGIEQGAGAAADRHNRPIGGDQLPAAVVLDARRQDDLVAVTCGADIVLVARSGREVDIAAGIQQGHDAWKFTTIVVLGRHRPLIRVVGLGRVGVVALVPVDRVHGSGEIIESQQFWIAGIGLVDIQEVRGALLEARVQLGAGGKGHGHDQQGGHEVPNTGDGGHGSLQEVGHLVAWARAWEPMSSRRCWYRM